MRFSHSKVSYEVNGVKYDRLEDVPAEFRKYFEDKDNNGVPDVIDDAMNADPSATQAKMTTVKTHHFVTGNASNPGRGLIAHMLRNPDATAKINCTQCGYDLTGTAVSGKCPECGTDVAASILALTQRAPGILFEEEPLSINARFAIREFRRFLTAIIGVIIAVAMVLLYIKYLL